MADRTMIRADGFVEIPDADTLLPLGCSKVGGRPDMPSGFVWPRWQLEQPPPNPLRMMELSSAGPFSFVAQINLCEVDPYDAGSELPGRGLLSFFYSEEAFVHVVSGGVVGASGGVVQFTDADEPLRRTDFPDDLEENSRYLSTRLLPKADFTLHPWPDMEPTDPEDGLSKQEWQAYRYDVLPSDADGPLDRMLGYPDLIQDTPTPGEHVLLLQIDGDRYGVHSVGAGRIYFLIDEAHLRDRRFEHAYFDYECD